MAGRGVLTISDTSKTPLNFSLYSHTRILASTRAILLPKTNHPHFPPYFSTSIRNFDF